MTFVDILVVAGTAFYLGVATVAAARWTGARDFKEATATAYVLGMLIIIIIVLARGLAGGL